jgi:hypothetical protein
MSLVEDMNLMETQGIFVDVFCPQCGKISRVDFSSIHGPEKGNLQIHCSCNSAIPVSVDFRRHHRKKTSLNGIYTNLSHKNKKGKMHVLNLSMNGIGFTFQGPCPFLLGDRVKLRFTLDDGGLSEISVTGIVRHITRNFVGCEFTSQVEGLGALRSFLTEKPRI